MKAFAQAHRAGRRRVPDQERSAAHRPDRATCSPASRARRAARRGCRSASASYRRTLQPDRRHLLESYRLVDFARKVVGVGSVGTRCWIALMLGRDDADPLFLQIKEAEASVLEPYAGQSGYANHGQRVVEGQRLTAGGERHLARLDPHRRARRRASATTTSASSGTGSSRPTIDAMAPAALDVYARLCGWTLAAGPRPFGRPRSRSPPTWASGDSFDQAIADVRARPTPTRTSATTQRWRST